MNNNKQLTIPDFLTHEQIKTCINLYMEHKDKSVIYIKQQVIAPNMAEINAKIGQENDATFLSYAVYYVLSSTPEKPLYH